MTARKSTLGEAINPSTGEVIEGMHILLPAQKRNAFTGGWFSMANDAIGELINLQLDGKLTQRDTQCLFAMLEALDFENWIRVSQKHLGQRLHMHAPHVSRSIKALVENGIIEQGPKSGPSSTFRLNPRFGWKGKTNRHRAAITEMEERMKAANIDRVITNRDPNTVDFINGKADAEESQQ